LRVRAPIFTPGRLRTAAFRNQASAWLQSLTPLARCYDCNLPEVVAAAGAAVTVTE
jgi:hypothetical protein